MYLFIPRHVKTHSFVKLYIVHNASSLSYSNKVCYLIMLYVRMNGKLEEGTESILKKG